MTLEAEEQKQPPAPPRIRIAVPKQLSMMQMVDGATPKPNNFTAMDRPAPKVSPTPFRIDKNKPAARTDHSTRTTPHSNSDHRPKHKSSSLPAIPPHILQQLSAGTITFPSNAEPCALKLSPTGHFLAVAFTDGTLRLYDVTGRFACPQAHSPTRRTFVSSTHFQKYGAVAAQIHAKGVHTSLLMTVDVSPDGLWFFGGAMRGSMELVAVYMGDLEEALIKANDSGTSVLPVNMLDLVTVHRHSDAKLRGFSSCTAVSSSQYLLLTGRGIKNCHVWRFRPDAPENEFEKIMDIPTNGNTIKFLNFRRRRKNKHEPRTLQIISKSDDFKVRLWDLPAESTIVKASGALDRPSVYYDVPNTESALGMSGIFCLCGGGHDSFNQISLVSLQSTQFNAMELALPHTSTSGGRRSRRGDLKSVVTVEGMCSDAGQSLLEISDGSLVQLSCPRDGTMPVLSRLKSPVGFGVLEEGSCRKLTVARIGSQGLAVAAVATFQNGKGAIRLCALEPVATTQRKGFWGYLGVSTTKKTIASESLAAEASYVTPHPASRPAVVVKSTVEDFRPRRLESQIKKSRENTVAQVAVRPGSEISPKLTKASNKKKEKASMKIPLTLNVAEAPKEKQEKTQADLKKCIKPAQEREPSLIPPTTTKKRAGPELLLQSKRRNDVPGTTTKSFRSISAGGATPTFLTPRPILKQVPSINKTIPTTPAIPLKLPDLTLSPRTIHHHRRENNTFLPDIVQACDKQLAALARLYPKVSIPKTSIAFPGRRSTVNTDSDVCEADAAQAFCMKKALNASRVLLWSVRQHPTRAALADAKQVLEEHLQDVKEQLEGIMTLHSMLESVAESKFRFEGFLQEVLDAFPDVPAL